MSMKDVSAAVLIPGLPYKTDWGGLGYSSVTLISDGREQILCDVGHYAVRGEMIKIMKRHKITKVFLSHLHYDHCLNADLFADKGIQIYLNHREWDYLEAVEPYDIYTFRFFRKMVKRSALQLFRGNIMISPRVQVLETFGHSAGHSSLIFHSGPLHQIVAGDAIKTFKDYQGAAPDIPPYDRSAFLKTRKYIVDNFDVIVPGHGSIIKQGRSRPNPINLNTF